MPHRRTPYVRLSIRLTRQEHALVKHLADEVKLPMSGVIEDALREFLPAIEDAGRYVRAKIPRGERVATRITLDRNLATRLRELHAESQWGISELVRQAIKALKARLEAEPGGRRRR